MARLTEILKHPSDLYPLLKLRMAVKKASKDIPNEPHWGFCYNILPKVSHSYALVIQELDHELREALCIFYLVLRALDTIEDDTSLPTKVKVPILYAFHNHVYDRDWHFSCGRNAYKILMDEFHHVSTAFMELKTSYQEIIKDTTKTVGAGMAKFICNKIETTDDYYEYCHYAAALVGLGLSKIFHASGREVMLPVSLCYSMGLFLQKANIIRDYLDDINETPKPLLFWPPEIWSKYVDKLEDLKSEENLDKAVLCLNEMITDALVHVENCLNYLSCLHDRRVFRFCALPQIIAMGRLALFYDDSRFFKGKVNIRLGLKAKISHRTRTMADVYGAFFDFSSLLKSKVDKKKAKPTVLLSRLETIQRICRESGMLKKRKHYVI